jgi:hypothetical protein
VHWATDWEEEKTVAVMEVKAVEVVAEVGGE